MGEIEMLKHVLRAAAVLATFVPALAQADLLTNGSFETNSGGFSPTDGFDTLSAGSMAVTGWTVGGLGVDYVGNYWQADQGAWSIDLDGTNTLGNAQGRISQTFSVTPGQTYTVSFALAGNPDGGTGVKTVAVGVDNVLQDFSFDVTGADSRSNMGYVDEALTFTATTPLEILSFASLTPGDFGPVIDDVAVNLGGSNGGGGGGGNNVPEPGTLALFGAGLLATFGYGFKGLRANAQA
jgi:choice-of-anchor C domain-containing protein